MSQFARSTPRPLASLTVKGAMPIDTKFNGSAPLKTMPQDGNALPNRGIRLPKPGFF